MSAERPIFEKKEMNLFGTPFVYFPVEIPVYTVEITHREPIDGAP